MTCNLKKTNAKKTNVTNKGKEHDVQCVLLEAGRGETIFGSRRSEGKEGPKPRPPRTDPQVTDKDKVEETVGAKNLLARVVGLLALEATESERGRLDWDEGKH